MTEGTKESTDHQREEEARPLQEGLDYYVENGLMVFTATFLQRRGYCCESGCRHCPFGFDQEKPGSHS